MPTILAKFKQANSFNAGEIDEDNGIIKGVRLAEIGRIACFEGPDGKPKFAKITPEFVSALLSFAGNSVPVHWTHDYTASDADPLSAKVGTLRNFRRDEEGNPIADLMLCPSQWREQALWHARHDRTGMMLSPVYGYDKADADCIPLNFRAADLVECGAATTALFSGVNPEENNQQKEQPKMELDAFVTLLLQAVQNPDVSAAIAKIAVASDDDKPSETEAALADETAAAAMEADAGVTDEDKKKEDESQPALMRAFSRSHRALKRQLKSSADEAVTKAEARFTGKIGSANRVENVNTGKGDKVTEYIEAQMKTGATRGTAIARMARDNKDLYNEAITTGKL